MEFFTPKNNTDNVAWENLIKNIETESGEAGLSEARNSFSVVLKPGLFDGRGTAIKLQSPCFAQGPKQG
jgi:hypothetical protein